MKKILTFIVFTYLSLTCFSQNAVVNSGEDASNFLGAYFSPFAESIGAGLNRGWYNTAKPHKLAGIDVSLTINLVSISDEAASFDVNSIDNFSSNATSTPTVLGNGQGAEINYQANGINSKFIMPNQDIELKSIPIPTLNAGIGLIKGTELNVRYIPNYSYDIGFIGSGSLELIGGGLKHDILQWIPLAKMLPFDLSIQGAFSQLKTSFQIESQSVRQDVGLDINATTFNLIISKKFSVVSAYASIGRNTVNSVFRGNTNFKLGSSQVLEFDVPLELNMPTVSELQASAGVRFQFAIFTLYANQTFSDYPVTSAGIGLSFR